MEIFKIILQDLEVEKVSIRYPLRLLVPTLLIHKTLLRLFYTTSKVFVTGSRIGYELCMHSRFDIKSFFLFLLIQIKPIYICGITIEIAWTGPRLQCQNLKIQFASFETKTLYRWRPAKDSIDGQQGDLYQ